MKSDRTVGPEPTFKWVAECLYRHTRAGTYYALVKRNGRQIRKSLETNDRQLAERRLADFRLKAGRVANPTKDRGTTFMELASDLFEVKKTRLKRSSARGLSNSIRHLNKHFGTKPVRTITTADCRAWEKMRGAQVSPSSFNHGRTALVAVLNHAVSEGLIVANPALAIPHRKLPRNKIYIPTKDQFHTLVKTIRELDVRAEHAANLVELLAYTGMRKGEAINLTWGDIDFERGSFAVTGGPNGTKNHEARIVPMFPDLRALLERIKACLPKPPSRDSVIIPIGDAKKAIQSACKKAGLPRFYHHLFRHFFVSMAIEANVDFKTIASWVGHKDGGVLVAKTYGHLTDTHSFAMAKKMSFSAVPQ